MTWAQNVLRGCTGVERLMLPEPDRTCCPGSASSTVSSPLIVTSKEDRSTASVSSAANRFGTSPSSLLMLYWLHQCKKTLTPHCFRDALQKAGALSCFIIGIHDDVSATSGALPCEETGCSAADAPAVSSGSSSAPMSGPRVSMSEPYTVRSVMRCTKK